MTLRLASLLDHIARRKSQAGTTVSTTLARAAAVDPLDRLARIVVSERAREQRTLRVRVLHQSG